MKIASLELFKVPPRWLFLKISADAYLILQYSNIRTDTSVFRKGPGLGIEINEEAVREAAKKGHDWKNPVWRNRDGSVAEW